MSKVSLEVKSDFFYISINGKNLGCYKLEDLAEKCDNNCSTVIMHLGNKQVLTSSQRRTQLLIPVAELIEKHHPNTMNWLATFKKVELSFYEDAVYENERKNDFDDIAYVNLDSFFVDSELKSDLESADSDSFILEYLKEKKLLNIVTR